MRYGLRAYETEEIIRKRLEDDPDLQYYIDDEYITRAIQLIVSGIGEAIEKNNKKLIDDITAELRRR